MTVRVAVQISADQVEGTRWQVLRWLKCTGDPVTHNEPLLELETDKVTIELPAPASGILREILKDVGAEVDPGEILAYLESSQTPIEISAGPAATAPVAASGELAANRPARLSPAVRRLLRERALDPTMIVGTGRGGRLTASDVVRFNTDGVRQPIARPVPSVRDTPAPGAATPTGAAVGESVDRRPHSPMRRRIAERMVASLLHTAPHVTTVFEADLGSVIAHRLLHRDEFAERGAPLTLTAYFARAAVDAIREVPEANARWTETELELYRHIDLGVATAVGDIGLVVPVLRHAAELDLYATALGLADLTDRARAGRLTPADVRAGTFTISNHGVSGSLLAAPIVINQPQSAILGIGKLEKRVVVVSRAEEELIAIRPRCYVTLTIDHRVMDGARANRFLSTFTDALGSWGSRSA